MEIYLQCLKITKKSLILHEQIFGLQICILTIFQQRKN